MTRQTPGSSEVPAGLGAQESRSGDGGSTRKATKTQARACYDNYYGTLRCLNGGTQDENIRNATACRQALEPYVAEAARLAAQPSKLLAADEHLMKCLTEYIPQNFTAFLRRYFPTEATAASGAADTAPTANVAPAGELLTVPPPVARELSWAEREELAERTLQRAGLFRATSGPAWDPTYSAFSATLPETPKRASWQEVLADVNAVQPIAIPAELQSPRSL